MIKIFPKSRVCVIDCQSSFEQGLKTALNFCHKYNIPVNSSDGKKLILSFCIKDIEHLYKNTKSQYPKVICLSKKFVTRKLQVFVDNYFDKMMSYFPAPYCGKYDLNSPDLETAAESSLRQQKPQRRFQEFLADLKVRHVN